MDDGARRLAGCDDGALAPDIESQAQGGRPLGACVPHDPRRLARRAGPVHRRQHVLAHARRATARKRFSWGTITSTSRQRCMTFPSAVAHYLLGPVIPYSASPTRTLAVDCAGGSGGGREFGDHRRSTVALRVVIVGGMAL